MLSSSATFSHLPLPKYRQFSLFSFPLCSYSTFDVRILRLILCHHHTNDSRDCDQKAQRSSKSLLHSLLLFSSLSQWREVKTHTHRNCFGAFGKHMIILMRLQSCEKLNILTSFIWKSQHSILIQGKGLS